MRVVQEALINLIILSKEKNLLTFPAIQESILTNFGLGRANMMKKKYYKFRSQ